MPSKEFVCNALLRLGFFIFDFINLNTTKEVLFTSLLLSLKDKKTPQGQRYSNAEYYLHIYRLFARPIDIRMKDTFEIVEKGANYEIYKLR